MHTTYRIHAYNTILAVVVGDSNTILETPPVLTRWTGFSFESLREHANKNGWLIEPVLDVRHPVEIEYHGLTYRFHWRDDVIARVTATDGDSEWPVRVSQLPEFLKGML